MAPRASKGKGKAAVQVRPSSASDSEANILQEVFQQAYSQLFATKTELLEASGSVQRKLVIQLGEELVRSILTQGALSI
jgi:hypothetical protein